MVHAGNGWSSVTDAAVTPDVASPSPGPCNGRSISPFGSYLFGSHAGGGKNRVGSETSSGRPTPDGVLRRRLPRLFAGGGHVPAYRSSGSHPVARRGRRRGRSRAGRGEPGGCPRAAAREAPGRTSGHRGRRLSRHMGLAARHPSAGSAGPLAARASAPGAWLRVVCAASQAPHRPEPATRQTGCSSSRTCSMQRAIHWAVNFSCTAFWHKRSCRAGNTTWSSGRTRSKTKLAV